MLVALPVATKASISFRVKVRVQPVVSLAMFFVEDDMDGGADATILSPATGCVAPASNCARVHFQIAKATEPD